MPHPNLFIPEIKAVDVRLEGARVVIVQNGRKILDVPCGEVADTLAQAIWAQSRKGEELQQAERIVFDNAILLRKGIPIGLSNHPKILEETRKEAAWNSDLRRYLPGGVKSEEQFGTPAIKRHAPAAKKEGER